MEAREGEAVVKLAFVADSQVDEHSRLAEHDRVMSFVVEDAAGRGCELLAHGGDVYERRSTFRERFAVREWINAALMQVVICGGNHEAAGEVEELNDPELPTHAFESPVVRVLMTHGGNRVAVAVLPWPRRERLREWFESVHGRQPSIDEANRTAAEMLRDVLRGLGAELARVDPSVPRVLVAHVAVEGYRTDPDQPEHVGEGMSLSVEDLMLAGADVVLLGHVHLPQHWTGTRADGVEVPVIYAGSPRRTAYASGELVQKGYVVVSFEGRAVTWERIPTPATPMQLVEAKWVPDEIRGEFDWGGMRLGAMPAGAEIRFRYEVQSDRREAAKAEAAKLRAEWLLMGAAEVKVEEVVIATTRARAPEVAAAETLPDKVRAVLRQRGDVEPERVERVVALMGEIEG